MKAVEDLFSRNKIFDSIQAIHSSAQASKSFAHPKCPVLEKSKSFGDSMNVFLQFYQLVHRTATTAHSEK